MLSYAMTHEALLAQPGGKGVKEVKGFKQSLLTAMKTFGCRTLTEYEKWTWSSWLGRDLLVTKEIKYEPIQ